MDEDLLLEELKALQDTEEAFDLFADEFQDGERRPAPHLLHAAPTGCVGVTASADVAGADLFGGTSTDIDEGMVAEFAEFSDEFAELAVKLAGQIETAKSRASSRKSSVREVAVRSCRHNLVAGKAQLMASPLESRHPLAAVWLTWQSCSQASPRAAPDPPFLPRRALPSPRPSQTGVLSRLRCLKRWQQRPKNPAAARQCF